jgi:hypothetical protein
MPCFSMDLFSVEQLRSLRRSDKDMQRESASYIELQFLD